MSTMIAKAMGSDHARAAVPAINKMRRISSVAYATEERASEESIASAFALVRRSCTECSVLTGVPISTRFTELKALPKRVRGASVAMEAASTPLLLRLKAPTLRSYLRYVSPGWLPFTTSSWRRSECTL